MGDVLRYKAGAGIARNAGLIPPVGQTIDTADIDTIDITDDDGRVIRTLTGDDAALIKDRVTVVNAGPAVPMRTMRGTLSKLTGTRPTAVADIRMPRCHFCGAKGSFEGSLRIDVGGAVGMCPDCRDEFSALWQPFRAWGLDAVSDTATFDQLMTTGVECVSRVWSIAREQHMLWHHGHYPTPSPCFFCGDRIGRLTRFLLHPGSTHPLWNSCCDRCRHRLDLPLWGGSFSTDALLNLVLPDQRDEEFVSIGAALLSLFCERSDRVVSSPKSVVDWWMTPYQKRTP